MKKKALLLQAVTVFIGLVVLAMLIRLPLTEGRAINLDLISIYSDPFILYGYAAAVVFFIALYKIFKLLAHVRQDKLLTPQSVKYLQTIKYCAIVFSVLIVGAGLFIKLFHNEADDPAGFLAMCGVTTLLALAVAAAAARFEKNLQRRLVKS